MPQPAPYSLASDHHYPAHPAILQAFAEVNTGFQPSYEEDIYSQEAKDLLKSTMEAEEVLFVFNGTAANVLSLKLFLPPASSVVCADTSHVFLDEAGAPEALAGAKLIPVKSHNGKITADKILDQLHRQRDQHFAPVRMVSVSQPTELGTVYSLEELEKISAICRAHRLTLHVDGARLPQAAVYLNTTLREATHGADVISFGGTKNGLVFGEAVLLRRPPLYPGHAPKIRKQFLQLPSKSRYLGAQFLTFLKNDLWREIATTAHQRALELARGLEEMDISPLYPVQSNAVFAHLPKTARQILRKKYFFYVWDAETSVVRLMSSFHLTEDIIRDFLNDLRAHL